jgi:peptidoglycan L-alanyl-D-glutamate endopeptidase CwlK
MALNRTSLQRLQGVHPDLVRVIKRAAANPKTPPFMVVEGVRTLARQKQLLKAGATKILRSRHITGHAVDLVPLFDGKPRWDWSLYLRLAEAVRAAALSENVRIRWGGTWTELNAIKGAITSKMLSAKFPDGPHFELPRTVYRP